MSTVPSDLVAEDGELAMCLDAANDVGDIRPLRKGTTVFALAETDTVLFLHKNDNIVHYIIRRSATSNGVTTHALFFRTEDSATLHEITINSAELSDIAEATSIGNTIIFIRQAHPVAYMLWKGYTEGYKFLGTHIPEVDIRFGLRGTPVSYSNEESGPKQIEYDNETDDLLVSEDNHELARLLKSAINPFIAEHVTDKGKFCFPFFVRFALRLYDGTTLVNHSAPILMTPSTKFCPAVFPVTKSVTNGHHVDRIDLLVVAAQLQYQYQNEPALADWKDIVKSVDVFITPPIYTYNVDGETARIEGYDINREDKNLNKTRYIGSLTDPALDNPLTIIGRNNLAQYGSWTFQDIYNVFFPAGLYSPVEDFPVAKYCYELPQLSEDKKRNLFTDAYNFYLLKSFEIDELSMSMANISVDKDVLKTLVNREVMTDDYRTHEKFIAASSYTYNARLNLGNIRHSVFEGFGFESMVCKFDGPIECQYGTLGQTKTATILLFTVGSPSITATYIFTKCEENSVENIVKKVCGGDPNIIKMSSASDIHWPLYLYYPGGTGKTMTLRMETSDGNKNFVLPLRRHPFLNGNYCCVPAFGSAWNGSWAAAPEPTAANLNGDAYFNLPNRIFTSEINNPFYFPATGMNAVGNGSIFKLSSAAKAMSTGQFGEHPMYAFTSEGIFALSVSQDGTFSSRQPFTRDVAIPGSITQLDSTVVFITNRGLMSVSGSVLENLSEKIEADLFDISKLSGLTGNDGLLRQPFGITLPTFENWKTFVKGDCRMLYDYDNERLYLYKPDGGYAYTLSLKSGYWAVSSVNIHKGINSYPDCLCEIDSEVVNLSVPSSERYGAALIITRPVKLNTAYSLKTIRDVVQIETSGSGLSQLLYGSRNGDYWELIDSSNDKFIRNITGNPYLYFRLVVIIASDEETTVNGAYINFIERVRQ